MDANDPAGLFEPMAIEHLLTTYKSDEATKEQVHAWIGVFRDPSTPKSEADSLVNSIVKLLRLLERLNANDWREAFFPKCTQENNHG